MGEAPVAVLIDDVLQINSRTFDQALFDLESIEVLRGPQGALYGRNATGGAIIIQTKRPADEFEGYAKVTVGKGDEYQLEGSITGPIVDDKVSGRLSVRYMDRDGYLDNIVVGSKADYYEDTTIRGHLSFRVNDEIDADLRASIVRTEGGAINYTYQPAIVDGETGAITAFDFGIADADIVQQDLFANNLSKDKRDIDQVSLRINVETSVGTFRSVTAYDSLVETIVGDQFPYTLASTLNPGAVSIGFDGGQSQHIDVEAISKSFV